MKLAFSAYCGMTWDVNSENDREAIRRAAAKFIRRRRNEGQRVVKLRHNVWECQEPEDCVLIPDTAGVLSLDDSETEEYEEYNDD